MFAGWDMQIRKQFTSLVLASRLLTQNDSLGSP